MADPVVTPPAAPAPVPAPAEPVIAAPASQPAAIPLAAEPAPATAAPATPPTIAQAPASAEKPAEPTLKPDQPAAPAPTLLEKFDKEKTDKVATPAAADAAKAKPAVAAKPTEAAKPGEVPAQAAAPAPLAPVEYKYTLPETIKMDDTLKGEVHAALDNFRANPAEGAQTLINLHEKQMRDYAQFLSDEQHRIFAETRQGWAKQVLSDSEIGGSGHQTAMGAIARMRDLLVPEKDRPQFEEFLRTTGAGDHPQFLKLLHQAARYYDEPTLPPPNPRPPAGNGQRPARRLRDIYDHTRSNPEGRS